jgi:hypothetical protein
VPTALDNGQRAPRKLLAGVAVSLEPEGVCKRRRWEQGALLRCAECGAESDQLATGWRAYLAGELEEDGREADLLTFCPTCAEREFGPFGWELTE